MCYQELSNAPKHSSASLLDGTDCVKIKPNAILQLEGIFFNSVIFSGQWCLSQPGSKLDAIPVKEQFNCFQMGWIIVFSFLTSQDWFPHLQFPQAHLIYATLSSLPLVTLILTQRKMLDVASIELQANFCMFFFSAFLTSLLVLFRGTLFEPSTRAKAQADGDFS